MEAEALKEMLQLLGLSTPFIYATATYYFFHLMDRKASGAAKSAISDWFKSVEYDVTAVNAAIVEAFDRVYGRPLLSWRSFARSSLITTAITWAYFIEFFIINVADREPGDIEMSNFTFLFYIFIIFGLALIFNILTDYFSLFFVRKWLGVKWRIPTFGMVGGAVVGVFLVLLVFLARLIVAAALIVFKFSWFEPERSLDGVAPGLILASVMEFFTSSLESIHMTMTIPAAAVHMWLVLFVLAIWTLRFLSSFVWAVGRMQWFLKRGRNHPFDAIGYVAALIVLVVATATSILGRALS